MSNEIPWAQIVANLDDETHRAATHEAISAALTTVGEGAEQLAAHLAPLVKGLNSGDGKRQGLTILGAHVRTVPEVRELALELSTDENATARHTAATALVQIPDDEDARGRLFALMSDSDGTVRDFAIRSLPQLTAAMPGRPGAPHLKVFPDDNQRAEVIRLLTVLEDAVHLLADLGVDDAQRTVIDDLIIPSIDELKELFNSKGPNLTAVQEQRRQGISKLGRLTGATRAVAIAAPVATGAIGNLDEAAANVKRAVETLEPVGKFLFELLRLPFGA